RGHGVRRFQLAVASAAAAAAQQLQKYCCNMFEPRLTDSHARRRRHSRVAKALPPPKDLLGYLSRYKPGPAADLVAEKFHLGYTHDRSNNLKALCPGCRRANISIKTVKFLVDQLAAGDDCCFQCRGGSCDFSLELSLKPARVEDVSAEAASGPAADALSSVGLCTSDFTTDLDISKLLDFVANTADDGQEQPVVSMQQQMEMSSEPWTDGVRDAGVAGSENQMWSTLDSHHSTGSDSFSWPSSSGDDSAISASASSPRFSPDLSRMFSEMFTGASLSTVGTPNYAGVPSLTSSGSPLFLQDQNSVPALSATAQLPPASEDRPILDGEFKLSNMLLGRTKFTFLVGGPTSYVVHPPQLSVEIHANMKLSFRICHAELPDGTIDRNVHADHAFSDEISVRATNAHGTVD
ncbi:hypothetical protein HK405_013956, partial [Cladochytrium tenue]